MEHIRRERSAEQKRGILHIRKQHQLVRIRRDLIQDCARLKHHLVRAEVGALQEHHLVLVREIQGPCSVLHDGEV